MSLDQDGHTAEPSYEGMDPLQLMVELNRNIQAVSVGKMSLDEANRRTRRINAVLRGSQNDGRPDGGREGASEEQLIEGGWLHIDETA